MGRSQLFESRGTSLLAGREWPPTTGACCKVSVSVELSSRPGNCGRSEPQHSSNHRVNRRAKELGQQDSPATCLTRMLNPAAQIAPALVEDAAVREAAAEVVKVANGDCGNCSKSRDVDPGRDIDDYATVRPETWREADHDCLGMLWQFDLDCRSQMSEVKSPSAAAFPGAVHTAAAAAPVIPPAAMATTTRAPADSDAGRHIRSPGARQRRGR